ARALPPPRMRAERGIAAQSRAWSPASAGGTDSDAHPLPQLSQNDSRRPWCPPSKWVDTFAAQPLKRKTVSGGRLRRVRGKLNCFKFAGDHATRLRTGHEPGGSKRLTDTQ